MSDHPFLRFINLISFDQKLNSLEREKTTIDAAIVDLKKREKDLSAGLDDIHKHVVQLKKRVDEHELEMKVLDQKEKDKKRHLENLSDYKEYQAIKAEVEAVQRMQIEQEKIVLDAWNQLENAQLGAKKKTVDIADQVQQVREQMHALEEKTVAERSEIDALIAQRVEKEERVPAEWLEKYRMMRSRVVDPVVEIFHGSCGACSQMITSQDLIRANRGALVQCQKCYRLLYAPEMMEKHVEQS